jgi:hypothetical protein
MLLSFTVNEKFVSLPFGESGHLFLKFLNELLEFSNLLLGTVLFILPDLVELSGTELVWPGSGRKAGHKCISYLHLCLVSFIQESHLLPASPHTL